MRKFEFVAVLDHHPAAMSPARDLPLCFRFMVLFTMLRQLFNVLLPENIPTRDASSIMSALSLWRKATVYRGRDEATVAKAAFCFDYTAL